MLGLFVLALTAFCILCSGLETIALITSLEMSRLNPSVRWLLPHCVSGFILGFVAYASFFDEAQVTLPIAAAVGFGFGLGMSVGPLFTAITTLRTADQDSLIIRGSLDRIHHLSIAAVKIVTASLIATIGLVWVSHELIDYTLLWPVTAIAATSCYAFVAYGLVVPCLTARMEGQRITAAQFSRSAIKFPIAFVKDVLFH